MERFEILMTSPRTATPANPASASRNAPIPEHALAPPPLDQLTALLDALHEAAIILDERLCIFFANRAFYDLCGLTPPEVLNRAPAELFQLPGKTSITPRLHVLREGRKAGFEVEWSTHNQAAFRAMFSCTPLSDPAQGFSGALLLVLDVTEKSPSGDAFLQATQEWERALDSVTEYFCIVDESNAIRRVNAPLAGHLGMDPRDVVGRQWEDVFDFTLSSLTQRATRDVIQDGVPVQATVCSALLNGTFQAAISPFQPPHGGRAGLVVCLGRWSRTRENLETLGLFATGIAHDFNNILGGIVGSIELAVEDFAQDDPRLDDLQDALRHAGIARKLIQQLLAVLRQEPEPITPLPVHSALREVLDGMRGLLPKQVRLQVRLTPTDWLLLGNACLLHQALVNLCLNAAQAMGNAGEILVFLDTETLTSPLAVQHKCLAPGDYIRIRVTDSGEGIDQDQLGHIFQPMYSTKKHAGGTGMGLVIVSLVVDRMSGGIQVRSQSGQGTAITLYLPRHVPGNACPATQGDAQLSPLSHRQSRRPSCRQ